MKYFDITSAVIIRNTQRAFTLVELLMVVSVLTILLLLVVPISNSIVEANRLSLATQSIVDTINAARQKAITQNRVVEVIFYKCLVPERSDAAPRVVAIQSFVFDHSNTKSRPLGEVKYLPEAIIISDDEVLSSMIKASRVKTTWTDTDPKRNLPYGIGSDYTAYSVRFRPDGSTDLGAGSWFLTVHRDDMAESPPPNHATVHIDAYNGSLRLYRPG